MADHCWLTAAVIDFRAGPAADASSLLMKLRLQTPML
jgi:hypothetical protein